MKPNAQCPTCLLTMSVKSLDASYICPNLACGSKVWPKLLNNQCLITINWDDLRAITYFASMWVDEKHMGSHERASILNIINFLEVQRKVLIEQSGRPNDFGALSPFIEARELNKSTSIKSKRSGESGDGNSFGGPGTAVKG
jgi:hypothetical protein